MANKARNEDKNKEIENLKQMYVAPVMENLILIRESLNLPKVWLSQLSGVPLHALHIMENKHSGNMLYFIQLVQFYKKLGINNIDFFSLKIYSKEKLQFSKNVYENLEMLKWDFPKNTGNKLIITNKEVEDYLLGIE